MGLQQKITELEDLRENILVKRKITFVKEVESIRVILEKEKQSFFTHLKITINKIIVKAEHLINEDNLTWVNQLKEEWNMVNKILIDYLKIRIINCNNKIEKMDIISEFSYISLVHYLELEEDLISNLSNTIGGSFTVNIARNVKNFISNKNEKDKLFSNVKKEILQKEQLLRNNLDQYFDQMEKKVKIYQQNCQPSMETSKVLFYLYSDVNTYQNIILQSKYLLDFVHKTINDVKN